MGHDPHTTEHLRVRIYPHLPDVPRGASFFITTGPPRFPTIYPRRGTKEANMRQWPSPKPSLFRSQAAHPKEVGFDLREEIFGVLVSQTTGTPEIDKNSFPPNQLPGNPP